MVQYVTHEDAREMMADYKRNLAKLKGCRRHEFAADGERFRCEACDGLVTDDQRRWYEQGVEHGQQEGHSQQSKAMAKKR